MDAGTRIFGRDKNEAPGATGVTTGAHERRCQMEGCNGLRISVRWADGKHTFPCSKGLLPYKDGWRIA
jgi:hypothetical protein